MASQNRLKRDNNNSSHFLYSEHPGRSRVTRAGDHAENPSSSSQRSRGITFFYRRSHETREAAGGGCVWGPSHKSPLDGQLTGTPEVFTSSEGKDAKTVVHFLSHRTFPAVLQDLPSKSNTICGNTRICIRLLFAMRKY